MSASANTRRLRAGVSLVGLALLPSLVFVSIASAEEPRVHLLWERPVGSLCPSRAALEADVEEIMDRRIFTPRADAPLIVSGVIDENATQAHVRIEARGENGVLLGTRDLNADAGRCASLRSSIVLVLTLFVEMDAGGEWSEGGPRTRLGIGLNAKVASVPMPRAAASGGPTFSLDIGDVWRIRADGAYWLPVSIETRSGVGTKLEAFSLALRACARLWNENPFGVRVCAGAEMGALIARPLMISGPKRQTRLLASGLADVGWEIRMGDVALLDFAVGPLLSLTRPAFSYDRDSRTPMPVYRPKLGGILFQLTFIILGS